ncbi:MAG: hypothetical protein GY925_13790 [Actinomycetia bacterium]|nr:hypothetical protein [Actinomycetes bacterium]
MVWHGQRAVLLAMAVVLVGCSGDGEESVDSTTTSAQSTTAEVTTTTVATTTTTTESTTMTTSVEDAVRDVHTRFMTELFDIDERVEGHEAVPTAARDLTTGPLLRRIEELGAEKAEADEYAVGPGYASNIVSVDIAGDQAAVVDCSQGRGERFAANGDLLVPADDFFKLRETSLVLIDGIWLVEEFFTGGEEFCDPEDYR